ncbi:unnamed protein product [Agarophyton chilense]
MVGSRQEDIEGDLFPRGAAPGSTPLVRKRNGQILFGPQLKRPKQQEAKDETIVEEAITRHGTGLSFSRLSAGMSVLALVTKADVGGVEFIIPGGIPAAADSDEVLIQNQTRHQRPGFKSCPDGSDSDSSDTDIGDVEVLPIPLYETLTVGSVVRAVVVDIESNYCGRKAARLSLRPELVNAGLNPKLLLRKEFPNYGVVKSVEDHGYVISFGKHIAHSGFLSFEKCHISRKEQLLRPGTPIESVTLKEVSIPEKRSRSFSAVVKLTSVRKKVLSASLDSSEAVTYRDLCAGMLVKAKVVHTGDGGLALTAFGVFNIEVDASHVPRNKAGEMEVEAGHQVMTRLIFVDSALKRIGGTLLDSMVKDLVPRRIPPELKTGTVLKSLIVDRVKPGFGVLMRHGLEDVGHDQKMKDDHEFDNETGTETEKVDSIRRCAQNIPIFAHVSRISDSKGLKLESKYQKGMMLDNGARIISFSRLDGVINVDLRSSVLSRKALTIDEVEPGSVYQCRVLSHTTLGSIVIAVDGDPYLPGIVPHLHVSDVPIPSTRLSKHPHLKVGAVLMCRVLSVKVERNKIYLTARKSLVSPAYPVLTSYEQAKSALSASSDGSKSTESLRSRLVFSGTSRMVTSKGGLMVEFCNGVIGLVRSDALSLDTGKHKTTSEIEKVYPVGETVHVRVVKVDTMKRRMFLSMSLQEYPTPQERMLSVGELVNGSIIGIDEETKSVLLSVSLNSSKVVGEKVNRRTVKSSEVICHLPIGHLSDIHGVSERLASEIRKHLSSEDQGASGYLSVSDLLVLSTSIGPLVSMKPSLRKAMASGKLPKTFDELNKKHSELQKCGHKTNFRGYIKALLPSGVIVGFLGDAVGFVRKSRIADQFVSDPSRFLKMYQSCCVVVENVDVLKKRITLSMRLSDVGSSAYEEDCIELFPCLEEWRSILTRKPLDRRLKIGSLIDAAPSIVRPFGTLYNLKVKESAAVGVVFNANQTNPDVVFHGESETINDIELGDIETSGERQNGKQKLRILDVDPLSGVVDLSVDKDIVSGAGKKYVLSPGNQVPARVLLVKNAYIILSVAVSKTKSVVAFALGPPLHDALQIRPGTMLTCKVIETNRKDNERNLISIDWTSAKEKTQYDKDKRLLLNVADITSISILKSTAIQDESGLIGMQISGKVTKSFPSHVFVGIGPGVVGHLHISNTGSLSQEELNSIQLGPLPQTFASRYGLPEIGSIVRPAYVCGVRRHEDKQNKLPMILELALSKTSPEHKMRIGGKHVGFVRHVSRRFQVGNEEQGNKYATLVAVGRDSWVSCSDVNCLFDNQTTSIKPGTPVVCMVTNVEGESKQLKGTISENGKKIENPFFGIVRDVIPGHGVKVLIPWNARREAEKSTSWGMLDICDVAVDFDDVVLKMKTLKDGDVVRVQRVFEKEKNTEQKKHIIWLTMRFSQSGQETAPDRLISAVNVADLETGQELRGFVRAVDKKGCFVSIGRGISAHVKLCDLSDDFVTDPKAVFPVGRLVRGKLSIKEGGSLKMSMILRKRPRRKLAEHISHEKLTEGTKVNGIVQKIEPFGALVNIGSGIVALLHKSEIDQDRFIRNTFREWEVGQRLTAIVIKIGNGKIKIGTKRCYFEAAGLNDEEISALLEENDGARSHTKSESNGTRHENDIIKIDLKKEKAGKEETLDGGDDSDDSSEMKGENGSKEGEMPFDGTSGANTNPLFDQKLVSSAPPLKVARGFNFAEDSDLDASSVVEDPEEEKSGQRVEAKDMSGKNTKKRTREKRERKREKEALEREIRAREETIANNPDSPETVEDYERLLMGDPNNSVLWIRYMAFCLGLSQIDKARSVAERALESINLESEAERVNLWCAYVNLEAQFGMMNSKDPELNDSHGVKRDAAVLRVFERACKRITDVKDFHLRVSSALKDTSPGLSQEILRRATRAFKGHEDVWIAKGQRQFMDGDVDAARQTLERALMSLDKQRHIVIISKFAQFEYKYGSPERGRTVFESLVGSFPKRLDLWNVYLDMEVGRCSKAESNLRNDIAEQVRTLYQRLVRLELSSKKMKFAFKKWLTFEKSFGTKEKQADVKKQAKDYVEKNMSSTK